jgi:hypothetical protein
MYPHERSLVKEMQSKPFALIGVNSDDLERAKTAIAKNELNWRSFQNQPEGAKKAISDDWRVEGWPTIVILDQDFKIRYRGHDGNAATRVAKDLVEKLEGAPKK